MSIRLRLALLYSAILALTLIVFSTVLFVSQSQATFGSIQDSIQHQAEDYANLERRAPANPSNSSAIITLRGRWTQTRNADGTVSGRTSDLVDLTLPLSEAGLRSAQNGAPWVESVTVDNEQLLIYTQPVMMQDRLVRIVQVAAPITEREQSLNTLRFSLIVAGGLTILAAFVIGWALAGLALRPIHQITRTAQTIGAERNFSRRVQHIGPNDEIGQLAITFNGMLTELESAYRHLEQALQTQRRFAADASHELRTPLTTIQGNIELLRHKPPIDVTEQAEVLADTKDETERLIRLVNQLLLLARSDAGRILRRESVPVKPLIDDVCRQVQLVAPRKTIICDASIEATIRGDRDALKQVLLILLDNALVHTPLSATIRASVALVGECVAIRVSDTGEGISPDVLPHIFERFYRGDRSRSGKGAGLGLSIAQELVQAQQGTLTVESELGKGTIFIVTLPLAAE
jgi:two-component system, OmpR family, sensor kinase